tara:strand:- start:1525 stop:1635 length:111 start_codon:yes stop_codon:yes gene_type:complete
MIPGTNNHMTAAALAAALEPLPQLPLEQGRYTPRYA